MASCGPSSIAADSGPPRTFRDRRPRYREHLCAHASGMKVGEDFFLCFSPERVDPGNSQYQTKNIPKVVGGITPACTEIGALFYKQALEHAIPVSNTGVAEMVKLLEKHLPDDQHRRPGQRNGLDTPTAKAGDSEHYANQQHSIQNGSCFSGGCPRRF